MTTTAQATRATVEAFYAAGAGLDFDRFFGLLHPEIVVYEPECLPYGGTYRGIPEVQGLIQQLGQYLDPATVRLRKLLVEADSAVATITIATQADAMELLVSEHYRVSGDKIVELRIFFFDSTPIGT
ncbi:nuclear transport factor 2 family protein [Mycobacterium sp. pUA109]|uniref:nuclear transport factor 2 family protein n=1 Tax=Mycobacterium sp. pUA109 TaxID=3238982 RepID=UPI00351BA96F